MIDRPTISFVVPTHREDRPLPRCLMSIAPQLLPGDEVLVVGDTTDGPLPNVQKTCEIFAERGYNVRYLSYSPGHHDFGHSQVNHGFEHATGDLLQINDDDDIWSRDAAQYIRDAAIEYPGRPLLFRFVSMVGTIFWEAPGLLARNHIGGHCLVQPNVPGMIGTMAPEYSGDFDMVERCVNAYGGPDSAVWIDKILCHARPVAQLVTA